jgi:hypothetical protein
LIAAQMNRPMTRTAGRRRSRARTITTAVSMPATVKPAEPPRAARDEQANPSLELTDASYQSGFLTEFHLLSV